MSSLMWIIFIALVAVLVMSLLWLVWKLRHFSTSQNQTYLDNKLMQAMLKDAALSNKVKKALVKKSGQISPEHDEELAEEEKVVDSDNDKQGEHR